MKKVFAIVALVAAMFVAGNAQAQVSVNLGYAPETFVSGNNSTNYQGFFAGVTYNLGIANGFAVAVGPQLRLNTRSESNTVLGITTSSKDTQVLIDVPVLFNYGFDINRDITVTPFVGPMLSLAATGTTKVTIGSSSTTADWYGDNSNMSRFNLYGVGGVALGYQNFKVFGGYRMGLLDLNTSDNGTLKTNGLFIGLGMDF